MIVNTGYAILILAILPILSFLAGIIRAFSATKFKQLLPYIFITAGSGLISLMILFFTFTRVADIKNWNTGTTFVVFGSVNYKTLDGRTIPIDKEYGKFYKVVNSSDSTLIWEKIQYGETSLFLDYKNEAAIVIIPPTETASFRNKPDYMPYEIPPAQVKSQTSGVILSWLHFEK